MSDYIKNMTAVLIGVFFSKRKRHISEVFDPFRVPPLPTGTSTCVKSFQALVGTRNRSFHRLRSSFAKNKKNAFSLARGLFRDYYHTVFQLRIHIPVVPLIFIRRRESHHF